MSVPFMQLYVADYVADTRHLTCEQDGAYMRLLMAMWRAGGRLPADPAKLARICGLSPSRWSKISPEVMAFFDLSEGDITQRRLTREIKKAEEKSAKRSEAGKRGGTAKALKTKEPALASATVLPEHLLEPEPDSIPLDKSNGAEVLSIETLDKATWEAAEKVLTLQGGMSQRSAKSFFGRLLSEHKLRARDMASAVADCIGAGTSDPQGYLTGSARRFSRKQAEAAPQKRVTWC